MTRGHRRLAVALAAVALLLVGACADGSESPSPSSSDATSTAPQEAVPTPEQLAAALVTPASYPGQWTVNVPPDQGAAVPGVVPEAQQALLPTIDLCAKASEESRSAAQALRWQAFRQLDQSEDDPIDPAAGDRTGHLVFVQEFLLAAPPAEVEATFEALRDGMRACQGPIPAGEEGPGTAEPMPIPPVGDARYGDLTTLEEAGGRAYWLLHNSLVRQGPVLMDLQVVDIVMGAGARPVFTDRDIAAFVTVAADRLP